MELSEIGKYKNKIFNIAIIILGLIIAVNIYKNQSKDIELLKQEEDIETKKNTVLGSISRWEKKKKAYSNLFAPKDASAVINTVNNMAKESGIRIISIKPIPEQVYPDYIKLPFNLILDVTSYHALGNFISKIESSQDVYLLEAIEIKSESTTKELRVDLRLSSVVLTR